MHRSLRNSLSLALCLCLIAASTAAFALVGTDTLPGDVCTAGEKDYSRMTADPDHDGASLVLYCDGSHWLAMTGGASTLDALTDVFTDYATNHNIIGGRAGVAALTTGAQYNTFWGDGAGATSANSTSATDNNTALGYNALASLTSGGANTAVGAMALSSNTTGFSNVAIGPNALVANTTGGGGIGIGDSALAHTTTENNNIGVGSYAGTAMTSGSGNVFLGQAAGFGLTSGYANIMIGYSAGENLTSGTANIIIGNDIDVPTATSSNTLNIGNLIYGTGLDGSNGTISSGNIGIGTVAPGAKLDNAGSFALSGDIAATISANTNNWAPTGLSSASVVRITTSAPSNLTGITGGADGRILTLINNGASTLTLKNNVTSTAANRFLMTADLPLAQYESATVIYDTTAQRWKLLAKGSASAGGSASTLDALTDVFTDYTTNHNVIGGRTSAAALTSGAMNNTFWGEGAGATSANSTSATVENTAFGYNALTSLTSGSTNVGIGAFSLNLITTGSSNTAVGDNSGASITGFNNTAIGQAAIYGGTAAGNENTAVGADALYNVTGGQNVALGMTAGDSITSGNKNIVIGYNVDASAAGASNELNIGNTLYGTGIIDGTVRRIGINVPAPGAGLDVGTDFALSGDITPTSLSADTNDWAPSGLSGTTVIRAQASAAIDLTGLTGGVDGRVVTIFNIGSNAITLKNQSTSSTALNRFAIGGDLSVGADQSVSLIYDATSQRWRSASIPFSASSTGLSGPAGCTHIGDLCADGTVFAGWHPVTQEQLFIPTTDQGTISAWKTSGGTDDIATDSTYDGWINANQVPNSTTFPAFKLCKDLSTGGYADWYLPSQVELYYLWSVRQTIEAAGNITNFQNANYWTSTEYTVNNAWGELFTTGLQTSYGKTPSYRVRCVRRSNTYGSSTYDLTGINPASLYDFESGALVPFETGGNLSWSASTTSPYAGTYSAQSGAITHSQETWLSLTVTLSSPKTLTFYYKTSTETGCGAGWCDPLHFYIDNDTKDTWGGSVAWTQSPSYSLPVGTHVLKWQYIRDSSGGSGSNAVWIDNIQFN